MSIARGAQRTFQRRGATRRRKARRDLDRDDLLDASLALRMMRAGQPVTPQRDHVLAAQRFAGNRAVAGLLGSDEVVSGTERASFTLSARIAQAETHPTQDPTTADRPNALSLASADAAGPGSERVEVEHSEPGEASLSMTDKIDPAFTFQSDIGEGNPKLGPDEFGLATWKSKIVDPVVAADPDNKAFKVTATIDCPIVWEVHSLGRTDVLSAMAPIKADKWPKAASDLTPDMSDDNGRPPRDEFWAKDLTERHERKHATDMVRYGKAAFDLATTWLKGKTAFRADDALVWAKKVPEHMMATMVAAYVPRAEGRAYGDGAASYKARAEAITKRGRAGEYGP